jgi:hypothetical protein
MRLTSLMIARNSVATSCPACSASVGSKSGDNV